MSNLPTHFYLMRDDEVIASLEQCRPSHQEMFWLTCQLVRHAGFAEIEPLIQQASNLDPDDYETFDTIYEQIHKMGVRLLDVVNGDLFEHFIIHIEGDTTVELRYA